VPVVGNLFKTKSKINNRDELLIFVTPKILREGSTVE
jgi:type IV pilus assembly protein PilQ